MALVFPFGPNVRYDRLNSPRRLNGEARLVDGGLRAGLHGLERGPNYASICTKYAIGTKIATPVMNV